MSVGISFTFLSFFYNIMLTIVYFAKRKIKNFETKLYGGLILVTLLGSFESLFCYVGVKNHLIMPIFAELVAKLYLVFLLVWFTFFSLYVLYIPKSDYYKSNMSKFNRIKYGFYLLSLVILLLILVLPIEYVSEGSYVYTTGICVYSVYAAGIIYFLLWIIVLIKSKRVLDKKFLPVSLNVILLAIVILIQKINPQLLLVTSSLSFITFLMYFTIENPDLKILEEVSKIKNVSEKTNQEKSEFLYLVTSEINDKIDELGNRLDLMANSNNLDMFKSQYNELKILLSSSKQKLKHTIDISDIDQKELKNINTKFNIVNLINSIDHLIRSKINDNVEFRLNIGDNLPNELYGDSIKLKQIILSLIDNSIKYTKEGFIELRVSSIVKNSICRLIITVEDSGKGIDILTQNEILNNHDDLTKEEIASKDNLVLNLKTIKKLVALIGGTLSIDSSAKKGSSVTISLDQKIVEEVSEERVIEKYSNDLDKIKKVAIISNNLNDIKLLKKIVKSKDYNFFEYNVTKDCLEQVRDGFKYDLIFIEENMEKINAYSFYDKCKEANFSGKIVVISKVRDLKSKKNILEYGFSGVINSPLSKSEVYNKIDIL